MTAGVATGVALVVLWLLFTLVFPWVDRRLDDPVLGGVGDDGVAAAAPECGENGTPSGADCWTVG